MIGFPLKGEILFVYFSEKNGIHYQPIVLLWIIHVLTIAFFIIQVKNLKTVEFWPFFLQISTFFEISI